MPILVAVPLTVCFVGCAVHALLRLRVAEAGARLGYLSHLVMAVTMLVMVWVTPPAPLVWAGVVGFAVVAALTVVAAVRRTRWLVLHHAAMAAIMALMWLVMVPAGHSAGAAHDHAIAHGAHAAHGASASLGLTESVLLLGAVLLVPIGVLWLRSRLRDRWLEGIATLGMALGAAAMAVTH